MPYRCFGRESMVRFVSPSTTARNAKQHLLFFDETFRSFFDKTFRSFVSLLYEIRRNSVHQPASSNVLTEIT